MVCSNCGKKISGLPIYAIMNIGNEKISKNDYCKECAPEVKRNRNREFKEQGKRKGEMLEQVLKQMANEIMTL